MTNTLCYIFAMIGTLLMFIGQGITEGFTFATSERRRENKIIRNKYSDKTSKGFLSYHAVRVYMENLGLVLLVLSAFFINTNILNFTWFVLGWIGIGLFIYERLFNLVSYGCMFPKKDPYDLNTFKFERTWKQDFIMLFIGIGLLVLFFLVRG